MQYNIIDKIEVKETFEEHVLSNTPFGIRTNGAILGGGLIDDSHIETSEYSIPIVYMNGTTGYFKYTTIDQIQRNKDIVGEFKIVCGQQFN